MKLLIVKPSSLGDIIHTFPAVAMLRQALPQAQIHWVANRSLAQIVHLDPGVERILPFPRQEISKFNLKAISAFIRELRQDNYDAVLDFQGLLRSGLCSRVAHSKVRYGFAAGRECSPWFYTHAVKTPPEVLHAADKNCYLAARFLEEQCNYLWQGDYPEAQLQLPAEWREESRRMIAGLEGSADAPILAVGCSSRWESKSWSLEFFSQVLQQLRQQLPQVRIWLLGSPDERQRAEELRKLAWLPQSSNLAGATSLGGLAAMLASSAVLLTNDSGPMHIAAAFRTPCVALFGSTNPRLTGPWGAPGRHQVFTTVCPRHPCFQRQCPRRNEHYSCHQGTDPAAVAAALLQRLRASADSNQQ